MRPVKRCANLEMDGEIEVAIITNIPTPYRREQWECYAKLQNVKMTVYYCAHTEKGRFWKFEPASNVQEKFLKGIDLGKGLHFNPGILSVVRKDVDIFMVGGYGYPTLIIAIILLKILRKPYIMLIDGVSPLTNANPERGFIFKAKKFLIDGAFAYFANGSISKFYLRKLGVPEWKIFNQYLTVNVSYFIDKMDEANFNRNKFRSELGIDKNTIVVLYCGRVVKNKGIQDLHIAVDKCRKNGYNVVALIVGEGPFRRKLEKQPSLYSGNAIFMGYVPDSELYMYYYASDIFVFPTHYDPWGLVVNEAMACGLPVIVSDAAGCHFDLVRNGRNGFVVHAGDVNGIVRAIELLSNSDLRKHFGEESLRIISRWTYKESTSEFQRLIKTFKHTIRSQ